MNSLPRLLGARATELRRSSAAGLNVVSQRPPLPPKIELRSHSYDGLLDDSASMQRGKATGVGQPTGTTLPTEGHDRVDGRGVIAGQQQGELEESIVRKVFVEPSGGSVGTEASVKSKNRRSRSMDDLFDDDGPGGDCKLFDNTQSMETLLEPASPTSATAPECAPETPPPRPLGGGNICLNRRFVREDTVERPDDTIDDSLGSHAASHEQLCEKETITVDSTPRSMHADDTGAHGQPKRQPDEQEEDDIESTHSSVTSSHGSTASGERGGGGPRKAPKPLINRYVKKVKSFMKM
ncbi:uncharacterized protein LOC128300595 [Anopheles moucheti]|uniref:uncharacterized protein LOC128300595 n=1 Tax=Anopheles moucheti TaxID=186751 RepID=UPI0022F092E5|nr:uncharacterized protein LOC128300595 [Anopheles moucheti]